MEVLLVLKGMLIGFVMAIPIGPLGVLCIRKSLAEGGGRGRIIGLAAASVDALYSGIAAFGVRMISDVIEREQFWVRLFGGVFLLVLGVRTLWGRRPDRSAAETGSGPWGTFFATILVALSNPSPIFAFIAVLAVFVPAHPHSIAEASLLVAGIFTGSGLWFLFLSSTATVFHGKINAGSLSWIDRTAGILIIVSGIVLFAGMM